MRILLTTTTGAGQVASLLPFALACRRAGQDVLVAAPPSAWEHVARARLPFAAAGGEPAIHALVRRWRPDVVLREHDGLLVAGDGRRFTLSPRSLDGGRPGVVRFRVPVGSAEPLPAWWGRSRAPLVYVSVDAGQQREVALRLGELDVRVLMTLGSEVDAARLGPLPANVHPERWVAQERVMPHAAAMVGDGGAHSTLLALAYTVPLAILPGQREIARRVAALGAGLTLNGAGHLDSAVRGLLDNPSFWLAAGRVSTEMSGQRPLDEFVPLLRASRPENNLRAA